MEFNTPFFSIVITTFNRKNYLIRALHSVFLQTFNSFEVIIVDDNSTDNTENIIHYFNKEYITYIKLPIQSGVAKARNIGIQQAIGKYIAFLDDDDEYLPDFLDKNYQILTKGQFDFTWCGICKIIGLTH